MQGVIASVGGFSLKSFCWGLVCLAFEGSELELCWLVLRNGQKTCAVRLVWLCFPLHRFCISAFLYNGLDQRKKEEPKKVLSVSVLKVS